MSGFEELKQVIEQLEHETDRFQRLQLVGRIEHLVATLRLEVERSF